MDMSMLDGADNAPAAKPTDGPAAPAPALPPHLQAMDQIHSTNKAQFEKLDASRQTLMKARIEFDKLMKLGDAVTAEDVIKAGGGLVAAGLTPKGVAGLMATLPQGGGEALAGWVQQHEQMLEQQEQQNQQLHQLAGHQLAASAVNSLASYAHEARGQAPAPAPAAPAGNNPLMPTAAAGGSALGV